MQPTGESVLDPRVRRTRRMLHDALKALVREKPYAEITVKDIVARAGVNRATFYAHYVDKEDLLRHAFRGCFDEVLAEWLPDPLPFSRDNLERLLRAVFEYLAFLTNDCRGAEHRDHVPLLEGQIQFRLHEVLESWIHHMQVPGQRLPVPPSLATVSISSAIIGAARHWTRQLERPSPEHVAAQLYPAIAGALEGAVGVAVTP